VTAAGAGERLKIVLSGMVAADPHQGGASWAVLQYFEGLRRLGHDVLLVEPVGGRHDTELLGSGSEVVAYFESLRLSEGSAALLAPWGETAGLPYEAIAAFAADADLLINVSGMLRDERLLESIPVRAFLDLDPGFNQVWQASGEDMGFHLHTHFATVGLRLGQTGCPIPTCGKRWLHTLPPVVLDLWPAAEVPSSLAPFTSVGHWRSYGSIEHSGIRYGQRAHSLRELVELPAISKARFRIALGIHPDEKADLEALRACGWELVDPREAAGTPAAYAEFIRASKAELSVAKSGYVASRSGWFSDRSACYLACGRPVVAQDTGFASVIPVGEGLLAYETVAEAAAAVAAVEEDLDRHAAAARALAEEHFDARMVLSSLLERLGGMESTI
jgi:hypothetical protein